MKTLNRIRDSNHEGGCTWCFTPVIPATQEAEIGRSKFEAGLGKVSTISYLKNKLKSKQTRGMVVDGVVEHSQRF
jgi:hypothetical protein